MYLVWLVYNNVSQTIDRNACVYMLVCLFCVPDLNMKNIFSLSWLPDILKSYVISGSQHTDHF